MNIGKLLEDCFEHLGVEATYCNKNKEGIRRIKVLIKRIRSAEWQNKVDKVI